MAMIRARQRKKGKLTYQAIKTEDEILQGRYGEEINSQIKTVADMIDRYIAVEIPKRQGDVQNRLAPERQFATGPFGCTINVSNIRGRGCCDSIRGLERPSQLGQQ